MEFDEQLQATKEWLKNATEDELEEVAIVLVENGYGVQE